MEMVSDTDWTLLWRFATLKVTANGDPYPPLAGPSGITPPPVPAKESALAEMAARNKLNAGARRSTIFDSIIYIENRPVAGMSPGVCVLNFTDKQNGRTPSDWPD